MWIMLPKWSIFPTFQGPRWEFETVGAWINFLWENPVFGVTHIIPQIWFPPSTLSTQTILPPDNTPFIL